MMLTRRDILGAGAGLSAAVLAPAAAEAAPEDKTLGAIAAKSAITYGSSIAADTLASPTQAALYLEQARIFTADWALVFGNLRPQADSFQPGDVTLKGLGNAQRSEIFELFPDLKTDAGVEGYTAARRTLKKHEALLIAR